MKRILLNTCLLVCLLVLVNSGINSTNLLTLNPTNLLTINSLFPTIASAINNASSSHNNSMLPGGATTISNLVKNNSSPLSSNSSSGSTSTICPSADSLLGLLQSSNIILKNTNTNASLANQTYNYQYFQAHAGVISIAAGTNISLASFSTDLNNSLNFKIIKTNSNNSTGAAFSVSTAADMQWVYLRINFLVTSRSDIEIGDAIYDINSQNVMNGVISYTLSKNWASTDYLRINTFLQEFIGETSSNALGYIINSQTIQGNLIIWHFISNKTTTIQRISLSIIIFESNNPAFRFEDGVITETFLNTINEVILPAKVDGQSRSVMVGLNSFVVQSSAMVSLYSDATLQQQIYSIKVSPGSDGCYLNYISLNYLILGINKCGFCYGKFYMYNDKCYSQCPLKTVPKAGSICQNITCKANQYINLLNLCINCPLHSNIIQCNNSCPINQYLVGEDCINKCNASIFEMYDTVSNTCVCMVNYNRINGSCGQCPQGTLYINANATANNTDASCTSICRNIVNTEYSKTNKRCTCIYGTILTNDICTPCGVNFIYNNASNSCICAVGLYLIQNRCGICLDSENYMVSTLSCVSKCKMNQTYDILKRRCACNAGYELINNSCGLCPLNSIYNSATMGCICRVGYKLDQSTNICVNLCPNVNQIYSTVTSRCVCIVGMYFIANNCGVCPSNSQYNNSTLSCACMFGYQMFGMDCVLICQKKYQVYSNANNTNNGTCLCQDGYFRIGLNCSTCSNNEIYDSNTLSCKNRCLVNQIYDVSTKTCVCINGLYLISNLCGKCLDSQLYNSTGMSCYDKCQLAYQIYNNNTQACDCILGYYMLNGGCSVCGVGLSYNAYNNKCIAACPANQTYNQMKDICECSKGLYFIKGQGCGICPTNYTLNVVSSVCVCQEGYFLINSLCLPCTNTQLYDPNLKVCVEQCKGQYQMYSIAQSKCICQVGYYYLLINNTLCGQCSFNQVPNSMTRTCVCQSGYYLLKGSCSTCPLNSIYEMQSKTCICQSGYTMQSNGSCITTVCRNGKVLWRGNCVDALNCPANSYFELSSFCCLCYPGYYLRSEQCFLQQVCMNNSYQYNGQCICNVGYVNVSGVCVVCAQNQIYNGFTCICISGYALNQNNVCMPVTLPSCGLYQQYSTTAQKCICIANYQWVLGSCSLIPTCPIYSMWNGIQCICIQGYVMNNNVCLKTNVTIPICPYNSNFNGVSCACNEGFFQVYQGECVACPANTKWDGTRCNQNYNCSVGFGVNPLTNVCEPIGQFCGPNANWNGVTCCCQPGYNNINKNCVLCPSGTTFDGVSCSAASSASKNSFTNICGSNQIALQGLCVCVSGFFKVNGICVECPEYTKWNGAYCECLNCNPQNWCMGRPFTTNVNGTCLCQSGYLMVSGVCLQQ